MKLFPALLVAGGALVGAQFAVAADAPPDAAKPVKKNNDDTCVFFSTVYDWRALDSRHLVLWAPGTNDPYLLETMMPLNDLPFADSLGFVDANHDGRLCSFGMDEIVVPNSNIPEHASITSLRKLDAAELAQLSGKYHVKLDRKKKADKNAAPPVADSKTE
jgi:hypothetical protein